MGAECEVCGTDLVFTDKWPEMKCPVCDNDRVKELEFALRMVLKGRRDDEADL